MCVGARLLKNRHVALKRKLLLLKNAYATFPESLLLLNKKIKIFLVGILFLTYISIDMINNKDPPGPGPDFNA